MNEKDKILALISMGFKPIPHDSLPDNIIVVSSLLYEKALQITKERDISLARELLNNVNQEKSSIQDQ